MILAERRVAVGDWEHRPLFPPMVVPATSCPSRRGATLYGIQPRVAAGTTPSTERHGEHSMPTAVAADRPTREIAVTAAGELAVAGLVYLSRQTSTGIALTMRPPRASETRETRGAEGLAP